MKLFSKKQPTSPKAYRTQGPSNKTNIPLSTGKPFGFKAKAQIPGDIGAASASSSSSAAADGIYEHEYDDDYNEGEEKELDECFKFTEVTVAHNGIIVINTTAMFFKEVESSIEKDREARVKKRSHRRTTSRSSMGSLDSIDEDRELDNDEYVNERKVRITTMLVPHDGEKCARFVANHLHKEIVEHPAFTSITTMPVVFRDAFVTTDDAFMKSTDNDDESGCSAITTVITSNNSICVAHIGDVRGIIQGTDGTIAELSPGHMIAKSPKEKNRLGKAGVYISSDQKIFGKLPYSRAFGHKTLKDVLPEGLICLPNIIQIQMNFASSGNDNGNTINSKSSIADDASTRFDSESHASLKSQSRKGKREDVILAIGSASSWSNTTDKKLCSTIAGSLFKGESVLETIENNILSTKPSAPSAMSMFKKHTETVQDTAPKGMCIVNWTRYV